MVSFLPSKNIAGVIFDNQQYTFAAINLHGAFKDFIGRR